MYKLLKLNDFRQFKNMDILLGKRLTVLAGRNSTGKSTILGVLANSGELKKKDGTKRMEQLILMDSSEQNLVKFFTVVKNTMLLVQIGYK